MLEAAEKKSVGLDQLERALYHDSLLEVEGVGGTIVKVMGTGE